MVLKSRFILIFPLVFSLISASSCGVLTKKETLHSNIVQLATQPMTQEKRSAALKEAGKNWLYGEGLGSMALNVGTAVLFPPYALFLLGNVAISASGYEPLGVSTLLNNDAKEKWQSHYSDFVSGPGRIGAMIADEDYRDRKIAKEKLVEALS